VAFPVPDLDPGVYTFRVSARDNYNNISMLSAEVEIGAASNNAALTEVYAFPNPFPETTRVVFTLDRSVAVKARIYSVSGRLVQEYEVAGSSGRNGFTWDGRDRAGDAIANGVYLLRLSTGNDDHLERLVLVR
jgi:flagellar hook assembly protein FlgD